MPHLYFFIQEILNYKYREIIVHSSNYIIDRYIQWLLLTYPLPLVLMARVGGRVYKFREGQIYGVKCLVPVNRKNIPLLSFSFSFSYKLLLKILINFYYYVLHSIIFLIYLCIAMLFILYSSIKIKDHENHFEH